MEEFLLQFYRINTFLGHVVYLAFILTVILISWMIASIPFAILFKAVSVFSAIINYLTNIITHILTYVASLRESLKYPVETFSNLNSAHFAYYRHMDQLKGQFRNLESSATRLRKDISESLARLSTNLVTVKKSLESAKDVSIPNIAPIGVSEIREQYELYKSKRRALIFLLVGLLGLLILIILNTMMLQEFFKGIVPGYLFPELLGPTTRLSAIIALFFSALEAFLGVVYYYYHTSSQKSERNLWGSALEIFIVSLVLLLAAFETYLYLQLSLEFAQKTASDLTSLQGFDFLNAVWMAPFGFVVVFVLFFVGHFTVENLTNYNDDAQAVTLKKHINSFNKAILQISESTQQLSNSLSQIRLQMTEFLGKIISRKGKDEIVLAMDSAPIESEIMNAKSAMSEINDEVFVKIDGNESRLMYYRELFFGFVSIMAILVFVFAQGVLLPQVWRLDSRTILLISIIQAAALLGASHTFNLRISYKPAKEGAIIPLLSRSLFMLFAATIAVVAVIGFNLFLAMRSGGIVDIILFLLLLACASALLYAGTSLDHLIHAVWCFLQAACLAMFIGLVYVAVACVWSISKFLFICQVVFYILGYPTIKIFEFVLGRNKSEASLLVGKEAIDNVRAF